MKQYQSNGKKELLFRFLNRKVKLTELIIQGNRYNILTNVLLAKVKFDLGKKDLHVIIQQIGEKNIRLKELKCIKF